MARLSICKCYTGCWICLNKPEYALIMSQYAWIYLNNAEYDWICQHIPEKKKQSAEYAKILNKSDPLHSIRSLHELLSSYFRAFISKIKILFLDFQKEQGRHPYEYGTIVCEGYAEFRISDYGTMQLNNAWTCLNMP